LTLSINWLLLVINKFFANVAMPQSVISFNQEED
jgi:hypothetical protein